MKGKDIKFQVWRVRLGKLFYVQGYFKSFEDTVQNHNCFEFSSFGEVAWLFDFKDVAQSIADLCGGIIEPVKVTSDEHRRLYDLRGEHTETSRVEWNIKGLLELEELEKVN